MSKLANWMIRLYPKRWRARYGDELGALLSDTGADARVVGDLFRGGVRMQLKTWPFLKLAFALGLVGLLLGVGIGQLIPSQYMSRATLQIQPAQIDESAVGSNIANTLNGHIQELVMPVMSRAELARIIRDPRIGLYQDELATTPLEDVIEEMRRNIHIDFMALPGILGKHASAFNISFTYPDRFKAQRTVTALIAAFEAQNQRQAATGPDASRSTLLVVDAANLPKDPVFPNWPNILLVTFLVGITITGIWQLTHPASSIRRRFAFVALAMGISGLAIAGAAYKLPIWPHQYQSTATLNLKNATLTQTAIITKAILSRTSLSSIINDPRLMLYKDAMRTQPLEDVIAMMQRYITVNETHYGNGTLIKIGFEYSDRYKAQQTVSALIDQFAQARTQLPTNANRAKQVGMVLDVLDNADVPVSPAKPNRYLIALAGSVFGILLAALISLIRRRWKPEADFPIGIVPE